MSLSKKNSLKQLILSGILRVKPKSGKIYLRIDDDSSEWEELIPESIVKKKNPKHGSNHTRLILPVSYTIRVERLVKVSVRDVVWIHQNGIYPDGFKIVNRDGNQDNCAIWNLILIPKRRWKHFYDRYVLKRHDWDDHPSWRDNELPANWRDQFDNFQLTQKQWEARLGQSLSVEVKRTAKKITRHKKKKKVVKLDFD